MKQRNSNIEILRIISILMIVLSHYTVHNGVINSTLHIGLNRLILEITTLGNIGVIIFLLITGYFCIEQEKPFKFKKLFFLYLQVVFYTIGIYLILIILKKESFSLRTFIKCILPITFKEYWFITTYIVLYIFIPFINKFIKALYKKEYVIFIIVSLLLFSILSMITRQDYYANELVQFILFYSIGAFLKIYSNNAIIRKYFSYTTLIVCIFVMIISTIVLDLLGIKWEILGQHSTLLYSRTSIVCICLAVTIFNIFINKKEFSNRFINTISQCILGVYLISDNSFIRNILWINILKVYKYVNSNYLILHMFISMLLVFTVCITIEYIRKSTIENVLNNFYNQLSKKINNNKLYKKIKYSINIYE